MEGVEVMNSERRAVDVGDDVAELERLVSTLERVERLLARYATEGCHPLVGPSTTEPRAGNSTPVDAPVAGLGNSPIQGPIDGRRVR